MEGRALADAFTGRMGHLQITLDNLLSNVQRGILERDPNDDKLSQLYKAIENNDSQQVANLVAEDGAKISINRRLGIRQVGFNTHHMQLTPLGLCCLSCKNELAKVLIGAGADVNMAYGPLSATALMTSSHLGDADMVRMLLESQADPSARDSQGCNSLTYAATGKCSFEIIRMLIEARAELNCKNPFGFTALHVTSGMGMDNAVSLLLSAGADPNLHTDFGHTPLHLAVTGKKERIDQINKIGYTESLEEPVVQDIAERGLQEWAKIRQLDLGIQLPKRKLTSPDMKSHQNVASRREKSNRDSEVFYGSDEDETDAGPTRGRSSARAGLKDAKQRISDSKPPPRSSGSTSSLFSCASGRNRRRSRSEDAKIKEKRRSKLMDMESFLFADMDNQHASTEVGELSRKYTNVVKMLLAANCDTSVVDTYNWTALDYAILSDDAELKDVLTGAGGDPLRTVRQFALTDLYYAIKAENKKDVKALLKDSFDVNVCFHYQMVHALDDSDNENEDTSTTSSENADVGLTPLTLCARVDNIELVKMLLKSGAKANQVSKNGEFPLAEGAINGNLKTVECLIKAGCDLNTQTNAYNGAVALILAVRYRHRKIVETLIKKGAKVDFTTKDGKTALNIAVEVGDQKVVDLLRSHTSSHVGKDLASLKQWYDKECPKTDNNADDFNPAAPPGVVLRSSSHMFMRTNWYPRGQRPHSAIEPMVSDLLQSRLNTRSEIMIPDRPRERTRSCDLSPTEKLNNFSRRNFTKSGDVDASDDFIHASQPDIVKTTVTSTRPITLSPNDAFNGDMSVIQEVSFEYDTDVQCNENDLNKDKPNSKDSRINDNIKRNVFEPVDKTSIDSKSLNLPESEIANVPKNTYDKSCDDEPKCVNVPLSEQKSPVHHAERSKKSLGPSILPSSQAAVCECCHEVAPSPSHDGRKMTASTVTAEVSTNNQKTMNSVVSDLKRTTDAVRIDSGHPSQNATEEAPDSPVKQDVQECDSSLNGSQSDGKLRKSPLVVVSHVEDANQGKATFASLEDFLHSGIVPEYDGSTYDRFQRKMSYENAVDDDEANNGDDEESATDWTAYDSDGPDKALINQMDMNLIIKNKGNKNFSLQTKNIPRQPGIETTV